MLQVGRAHSKLFLISNVKEMNIPLVKESGVILKTAVVTYSTVACGLYYFHDVFLHFLNRAVTRLG